MNIFMYIFMSIFLGIFVVITANVVSIQGKPGHKALLQNLAMKTLRLTQG